MEKELIEEQTVERILDFLQRLIKNGGPEENEYSQLDTNMQILYELFQNEKYRVKYTFNPKQLFGNSFLENTLHGWSLSKPYGYAGDYKMIDFLYTNHHSDKDEYVKWDNYYHYHQSANAVRNRKEYFKKIVTSNIKDQKIDLLNVASGPARDLKECYDLLENKSLLHTTCVELDAKAIEFAKDLCKDYTDYIDFEHKNILKFDSDKKYDIIWSAGLFDYFKDRTFIYVLEKFKSLLKPNGIIVVGNFSKSNPGKAYMELLCEWFLFYRTELELTELAIGAGFLGEEITIDKEPLGINLFLKIKKQS